MAVKPMLFTGEMVRAISARRKWMTRRIITKANSIIGEGGDWGKLCWDGLEIYHNTFRIEGMAEFEKAPMPGIDPGFPNKDGRLTLGYLHVPYAWAEDGTVFRVYSRWEPGDILWVKESWEALLTTPPRILYRADVNKSYYARWHSSILMPRWASRIRLEVKAIRPERLQDITEEDAQAEGVALGGSPTYVDAFAQLWDSLNAKRGHGWEANDWVWVLKFGVAYILGESGTNAVPIDLRAITGSTEVVKT